MTTSNNMSSIYPYGAGEGNVTELNGQLVMLNQDIEQFRRKGAPPVIVKSMAARISQIESAIVRAKLAQAPAVVRSARKTDK